MTIPEEGLVPVPPPAVLYGCAFILAVASERMHDEGHEFFPSADGVWRTGHVPPGFLRQLDLDGRV